MNNTLVTDKFYLPRYNTEHVTIFYEIVDIVQENLFPSSAKPNKRIFRNCRVLGDSLKPSAVVDWVRTPYYSYHTGYEDELGRQGYVSILLYIVPVIDIRFQSVVEATEPDHEVASWTDTSENYVTYFNCSDCLISPQHEAHFDFPVNCITRKENIAPLFRLWMDIPRNLETELSLDILFKERQDKYYQQKILTQKFDKKLMPQLCVMALAQKQCDSFQSIVFSDPDLLQMIWAQGLIINI